MAQGESREGNNPIPGSKNDPQGENSTANNNNDVYGRHHSNNQQRLGILARTVGTAAIAAGAIAGVGSAEIVRQTGDPLAPAKISADAARSLKNQIVDSNEKSQEEKPPSAAQSPTQEPQESVGDEALSAEKNDITDLVQTADVFVEELKKVPAAIMLNMQEQNQEGVKITLHDTDANLDKTLKFTWTKGEYQDKLTVTIETDDSIRTYTIAKKENLVTKTTRDKKPANDNQEQQTSSSSEIITALNTELKSSHQQWLSERAPSGENLTSSTRNIPKPTNTPEPTPTESPNP